MKLLKKKRIISSIFPVMLVLVAVLFGSPLTASAEEAWDGTAFSTDFAGSGTEADPYQIGTAKELAGLSQIVSGGNYTNSDGLAYAEAYYVLTADIVLNESLEGAPVEWNPIGDDAEDTFKGQFDGKGHTVSGVYILNEFKYNPGSGLFGYSEGTIQNVGVINSRIDSSSQYVGGICGYNMGSILNCYSTAAVSGEHFQHEEEVGGICGMNDGGTVENCFYAGKVKGAEDIGGICGENYQGTIKNCYSHAEFTIGGVDTKVGFVCGTNEDGTITDCYYAESFNLRNAVGTSTGTATDSCRGLTVEELAALDIDGAGTTWIAGEVEETERDGKFKTVTYTLPKLAGVGEAITPTTALYNFDVGNGDNWKTYVKVTTTEELQAMKDALNNSYVLMNDIAFTANLDADGRLIENPTETWIPIGNYEIFDSPSFTGCFDGAGHSISGLYIDVVETDGGSASGEDTAYYGLFGYSEGTIANVSVTESSISATGFFNAVAGICGENQNGVIYNCCFEGTLSGEFRVEGICNVNTGTVENCYSLGEINSSGNGICGTNTGTVKDCFSTMAIQDGAIICGHNSGGKIENCYYSTDLFVGDAIGSNEGDVTETVYGLSVEEFAALDFDGNGTAWTDGSVKEVMKGDRFKTVTYTLPSLKNGGIICSSTIEKYLFIIDGEESWQQYKPVSTIEELQAINHDLYGNYVLMNDITVEENLDRNGKLLANPVKEWAGIGCEESFKGIFDGRGFTVSGLYADDSANANGGGWGLFGSVEGTIMNVGVTESHFFMGNASAGGICGELDGEGIIRSCYNTATVEGTVSVGGICGSVETSLEDGVAISNCYNVGKIIATYSYAGGICGQNWDGVIEDCYSAGTVEGDSYIGGLCGQVMNGAVRNCWFDCDVAPIYPIGEIYNSEQTGVFKYGTAVMTGDDILTAMGFDKSIWGKKANDVANGIAYYPDLLCFADDEPSTKYVAPTPTATPGTDTGVTPAPTTEPGTAPTPGADATPVPTVEPGATPAPGGDVSPTLAPDMTPTPGGDTDVTPAPETVEQVKNFVTRMYTVVLARTPDEAGINDWTNWLLGHEIDGAGIAYGFIMSDEFVNKNLSDEEFIAVLYSTFFDRAADPEGLATWTNLLAQGSSRGFVLSGFVNSNEFDVLCESFGIVRGTMREDGTAVNPGIRQFVERCYSTVLGREGDKGGLDTWTNLIIAGEMSAETVAKTFFDSEEFINKGTTDADYINILYATFLDRVADDAGRATWTDGLADGMTRTEVLQGFSQSEEFKGILAGFGLQ